MEKRDGRVVITVDGEVLPMATYCDYITFSAGYEDRMREFAEAGVKVFFLYIHDGEQMRFWGMPEEGDKHIASWRARKLTQEQVDILDKYCPGAWFIMRYASTVPDCWKAKFPDAVQRDEDGKMHQDATLASETYLREAAMFHRNLVAFCESQPWSDRIVGYLDAPLGEGIMPMVCDGKMFDLSPENAVAFTKWQEARFPNEAPIAIPRDAEWHQWRKAATPTFGGEALDSAKIATNAWMKSRGLFHWIERDNAPTVYRYACFQREAFINKFSLFARVVKEECAKRGLMRFVGSDIAKQPMMGWQILQAFDGIGDGQSFPNILLFSGSWDVGGLLDDPNLDWFFTPADYYARPMGYGYESEGPLDSIVLRDKPFFVENDSRTYVGQGKHEQGAFLTPVEVEAGLLRNEAMVISRGARSYWCNVGSSYFHDDAIMKIIAEKILPMASRCETIPHKETRDAIALVIDDTSPLFEDTTSGYQSVAVIWQRVLGLAHCGVPYRIFLLSDLKKAEMPDYKVWLFPNLFAVNDEVIALLKRKVFKNGNVALFGPSTGISDGVHLKADGASALLGVPMETLPRTTVRHVVVHDFGHPITTALPANMTFGDSLPYGPTMVPKEGAVEAAGAKVLGWATTCWFINRPGLFIKEEKDYSVIWSCAVPLPAALLRSAARFAGCHIWCEDDDVIFASESFASIHSAKSGDRTLRLPRPFDVTDAVTGEPIGKQLTKIPLTLTAPETRAFILS